MLPAAALQDVSYIAQRVYFLPTACSLSRWELVSAHWWFCWARACSMLGQERQQEHHGTVGAASRGHQLWAGIQSSHHWPSSTAGFSMMLEHASGWFQTPLISWGSIIWGSGNRTGHFREWRHFENVTVPIPVSFNRLQELWRKQKSQQVQTCSSLRQQPDAPQELVLTWPPGALAAPDTSEESLELTPSWGRPSAPSLQAVTAAISFSLTWGTHSSSAHAVDEQQVSGLSETQAGRTFQVHWTYPAVLVHSATLLRLAAENHCLSVVNIGHSISG